MHHWKRAGIKDAWTAFWQDPSAQMQCIRGAPDITEALRGHWSAFAASLAPGARVLDLGCGAGAAARALVAARRDLHVTGIDFARVPSAADPQIELLSDTAMEYLPFADATFDAAISQYGYEYGRTHKTAKQLARVLAPGGKFSLLVHHAESSVVAANRARLNALAAFEEQDVRAAFLSGSAVAVNAEMSSLRKDYPGDTLVAELARVLPLRARIGDRERRTAMWSAVEVALSPERAILEMLNACCVAPEELDGWLAPLRQFCEVTAVSVLRKANGTPIAWRIDGAQKPAAGAGDRAIVRRCSVRGEGPPAQAQVGAEEVPFESPPALPDSPP